MRNFIRIVEGMLQDNLRELSRMAAGVKFQVGEYEHASWFFDPSLTPVVTIPEKLITNAFARYDAAELSKFFSDPFFGIFPHERDEALVTLMLCRGQYDEILRKYPLYRPSPAMLERLKNLDETDEDIFKSFSESPTGNLEWVGGEAHDIVTSPDFNGYHQYVFATDDELAD